MEKISDPKFLKAQAITISDNGSMLAIGGTEDGDEKKAMFFIIDPVTGSLHSNYNTRYKIDNKKEQEFMSPQSLLFAGASRLYFTGRSYIENKEKRRLSL